MQPIKTVKTNLDFRGKPLPVTIKIETGYEELTVEDLLPDDTEEQLNELRNKLDRGDLSLVYILVKASIDGTNFKASDSLGGCFVENDNDVLSTVKEHGMIEMALNELRNTIDLDLKTLGI